jgi:hypothetical protein
MTDQLHEVATELGIDLTAHDDAPAKPRRDDRELLVEDMQSFSSLVGMRSNALSAMEALTDTHPGQFTQTIEQLTELKAQARLELNLLKREFADTYLMALSAEALPQTRYAMLHAYSKACGTGYDAAHSAEQLRQANEWCDAHPNLFDMNTICKVDTYAAYHAQREGKDGSTVTFETIYEQSVRELLEIEGWLRKRLAGRAESDARKKAKNARQKALRAVNRERKKQQLDPLPDPDTKAGQQEIRDIERVPSSYHSNNLYRDRLPRMSAEEIAACEAEHARLVAQANLRIYGNEAGDPPTAEYVTAHNLRFGTGLGRR